MRAVLLTIGLVAVFGCSFNVQTGSCQERLCPNGTVCSPSGDRCVDPAAIEACVAGNELERAACSYPGIPDGLCYEGVCLSASCGNGYLDINGADGIAGTDDDEACDDGNNVHGDGCSADCRSSETCGNGVIDTPLGESCDDGRSCGDAEITRCAIDADCAGIGDETCRPRDNDGCRANCVVESCGDGIVDAHLGEECDCGLDPDSVPEGCVAPNSSTVDASCRVGCLLARCGDAIVDADGADNEPGTDDDEICDDGNLNPLDSCSPDCRSTVICGNAYIDYLAGELCDDGNYLSGDGCSSTCQPEVPIWRQLDTAATPGARTSATMVYDAARDQVVLFGGFDGAFLGDTWIFDGSLWTRKTPAVHPSPRSGHAMVYDSNRRRVVLFGGSSGGSALSDTWIWNGATWEDVTPSGSPPARANHAMAYDAARDRVVLFAGKDPFGGYKNDTWEWDGQAWMQRTTTTSPGLREDHAMAYDPKRGVTVLVGGHAGTPGNELAKNDTWEWDGAVWSLIEVADPSSLRSRHGLLFDLSRQKVVAYGGFDDDLNPIDSVDEWDGAAWQSYPQSGAPAARGSHSFAYDQLRTRMLVYGGSDMSDDSTQFDDMHSCLGGTWSQVTPPSVGPGARQGHAMAYSPASQSIVLFGGEDDSTAMLGDTWVFDDKGWYAHAAEPPPARRDHAMSFVASLGRVLLVAGRDDTNVFQDTWQWTGSTWSDTTPSGAHPKVYDLGMAYDPGINRLVLFGGVDESGELQSETWELDPMAETWELITSLFVRPTYDFGMVYDAIGGVVVLVQGLQQGLPDPSLPGDIFAWEGSVWGKLVAVLQPSPRHGQAMAFDAQRGRTLMFGGSGGAALFDDTWELDGANWQQVAVLSTLPEPRQQAALVWDASRRRAFLFGGLSEGGVLGDTWVYSHESAVSPDEACTTGFDGDGDGLVGCADPDCWPWCTPYCPPGGACPAPVTGCGDGVASSFETCRSCPADVGACAEVCGDYRCEGSETTASCPGDCP